MKISNKHEENIHECMEIFVPWRTAQKLAIGILVGALLGIGSLTWAAATIVNNNNADHERFQKALATIEINGNKLDKILKLLGNKE
jgi:hypothetical protein